MNQRPYEPADLLRVIDVYSASIHSLAASFYTPDQLFAWAPAIPDIGQWQQRLAPLQTIIAEHDGALAGFASYAPNGHLEFLYTHPAFARQGVATPLYLHVVSALQGASVHTIFTEASLAARPFFDHHGFQVDGEELVECRGCQFRRFRMHKGIGAA